MTTFEAETTATTTATVGVSTTLGNLLAAVKAAHTVAGARRVSMPILSHVKVEATDTGTVEISAQQLPNSSEPDTAVTATAAAVATVAPGCTLLPSKQLLDLLTAAGKRATKRVSDTWGVAIAVHDGAAVLDINGMEYRLTAQNAELFPDMPDTGTGVWWTVDTVELLALFNSAHVAASKDDTLPILSSLKLELSPDKLTVYSTDRYRLFTGDMHVYSDLDVSAVIPADWWKKTAKHLNKKTESVLRFQDNRFTLHNDGNTFTTQNVDGDYPKIRSLFPEHSPNAYVVDADMFHAVAANVAVAAERNTPIRLTFDGNGTCTLEAGSEDMRTTATVAYNTQVARGDEPMVVAYNPHYLLEGVKLFKGQQLTFEHSAPAKPALLSGDSTDYRYLLMPVRLPNS